jgi:hypothetical protein
MRTLAFIFLLCFAALAGCGGGQYGFTRTYEPTGDEESYLERVAPVSYEEVRRDPAQFRSSTVGWFGVVTSVTPDGSHARVALTHRIHQERHLCSDETAGSCRVTVSDRQSGPWTAIVTLAPEDREGTLRVWVGSLLKVYGSPNGEFDEQGGPVIQAAHYRHWPRGYYVTTSAAGAMRQ